MLSHFRTNFGGKSIQKCSLFRAFLFLCTQFLGQLFLGSTFVLFLENMAQLSHLPPAVFQATPPSQGVRFLAWQKKILIIPFLI